MLHLNESALTAEFVWKDIGCARQEIAQIDCSNGLFP